MFGWGTAAAAAAGCPAYDESTDGGADSSGGPPGTLNGHTVRCCYSGYYDAQSQSPDQYYFCLGGIPPCIDEALGTDAATLATFCDQKCNPSWDAGTVQPPASTYYDETFSQVFPAPGYLDACVALPAGSQIESSIITPNSCTPQGELPSFGEGADVAPRYGGFFSDRDGTMDVEIAGAQLTSGYELAMHFSLAACSGGGIDGGTCLLAVTGFDLGMHDIDLSGGALDYQVDADLRLSRSAVAEVSFAECSVSECSGEFAFSAAEGNALQFDLEWTQVNLSTQSTGHGAIHISNEGEGLGGVDIFYGSIHLDPSGEFGTINMLGSGEDSLGGDFASAEFMLWGYVETIDTEPGDCCTESNLPGGCSNKYITACVATHDPACYLSAWAESCVAGVEAFGCAACP